MIYHVTTRQAWEQAKQEGYYKSPSLATEGFIHCSKKEQVAGVLERYYKYAEDLLLLHIDEYKLQASLQYELSPSVNEAFPHLYGVLNIDAVSEVSVVNQVL